MVSFRDSQLQPDQICPKYINLILNLHDYITNDNRDWSQVASTHTHDGRVVWSYATLRCGRHGGYAEVAARCGRKGVAGHFWLHDPETYETIGLYTSSMMLVASAPRQTRFADPRAVTSRSPLVTVCVVPLIGAPYTRSSI